MITIRWLIFREMAWVNAIFYALVGVSVGRGTLHLYELVGVVAKVGVTVDVYAMVGITPRSE